MSSMSSQRGPTVVVTRGEDSEGSQGPGRTSSRRLGEPRGSLSSSIGNDHPYPSVVAHQTPSHSQSFSSHITTSSSSDSSPPPRSRTSSGQAGHRPTPLNISQPSSATDPRLPQAYQPNASAISSASTHTSLQTVLASSSGLPRSVSANPPPFKSNAPRPPFKSASSSSLHAQEARDRGQRPSQTYGSSTNPSNGPRGLQSTASGRPSAPPSLTPSPSTTLVGLPSNPRSGQQISHHPSNSLSGGSFTERRTALAKEREGKSSTRPIATANPSSTSSHRKTPSAVNTGSTFAFNHSEGVVLGLNGRPAVSGPLSFHPFATAAPATPSSPNYALSSHSFQTSNLSSSSLNAPTPTASNPNPGYSVGRGPFSNASNVNTSAVPFSLDDLKRKLIKFINAEDGHSRTVDLANCKGGVEVMEKVLRKFGKWNGGGVGSENESDDDGGGLCVDGWGVFLEGYSGEGSGESCSTSHHM